MTTRSARPFAECRDVHVHPDKGGAAADAQRLNAARDAWVAASKNSKGRGRPAQPTQAPAAAAAALAPACEGFRVRSVAVLLTYTYTRAGS